jgi:hypothetical protein
MVSILHVFVSTRLYALDLPCLEHLLVAKLISYFPIIQSMSPYSLKELHQSQVVFAYSAHPRSHKRVQVPHRIGSMDTRPQSNLRDNVFRPLCSAPKSVFESDWKL